MVFLNRGYSARFHTQSTSIYSRVLIYRFIRQQSTMQMLSPVFELYSAHGVPLSLPLSHAIVPESQETSSSISTGISFLSIEYPPSTQDSLSTVHSSQPRYHLHPEDSLSEFPSHKDVDRPKVASHFDVSSPSRFTEFEYHRSHIVAEMPSADKQTTK